MLKPRPELLVDPAWVEGRLADPKVQVFDCTLTRVPQPDGASLWESGRAAYEEAHVPGAYYLHMVDDLSAPKGTVPYGVPDPDAVAALLSSFGVSDDTTIVLYGSGRQSVVHRVWWVLTTSGFDDVRVLDGGWQRWRAEGRPTERGTVSPQPTQGAISLRPRPDRAVEREDVSRMLGNPDICLIHALSAEQYAGTSGQVYGRPGRIPGSINIPAQSLIDAKTSCFRPIDELAAIFSKAGVERADAVVPYCGGGIAATTVFLGLTIAGYDNVRLYDGSLLDWTADPHAPMVTDANDV